MATVADLQRLKALTDRLNPISKANQGEVIRAEDWNTLVSAVVDIAQTVLAEDREIIPAPHEHNDQVTVAWLDPRLRALIERGPLNEPAAIARLSALENRVERLATRIEEVASHIDDVRDNVTQVATRDLTRQTDIVNLRRVVEGQGDSRKDVLDLRETLGVLKNDLSVAANVRQLLTVNGAVVDMSDVVKRLNQADQLRESLRAPDGEVFNAQAFENRLTELTNTLVTQDTLDSALDTVRRDISPAELGAIEGRLRTDVLAQVNTSVLTATNAIREENNVRFNEFDGLISTRVNDAVPNIITATRNTLTPEFNALITKSENKTNILIEQGLADTQNTLRTDYTGQIADLNSGINQTITTQINTRLSAQLDPMLGRITTIEGRFTPLEKRLSTIEIDLGNTKGSIDKLTLNDTALRNDLLLEMDRRDQVQGTDFTNRLNTLDTTLTNRFNQRITDVSTTLLNDTRTIARNTALTEISLSETRLRNDFAVISRNSVTEVVRTELNVLQPTLTNNIATELRIRRPGQ